MLKGGLVYKTVFLLIFVFFISTALAQTVSIIPQWTLVTQISSHWVVGLGGYRVQQGIGAAAAPQSFFDGLYMFPAIHYHFGPLSVGVSQDVMDLFPGSSDSVRSMLPSHEKYLKGYIGDDFGVGALYRSFSSADFDQFANVRLTESQFQVPSEYGIGAGFSLGGVALTGDWMTMRSSNQRLHREERLLIVGAQFYSWNQYLVKMRYLYGQSEMIDSKPISLFGRGSYQPSLLLVTHNPKSVSETGYVFDVNIGYRLSPRFGLDVSFTLLPGSETYRPFSYGYPMLWSDIDFAVQRQESIFSISFHTLMH